jgi:thiol-disulfide isomerase/thioredoxin
MVIDVTPTELTDLLKTNQTVLVMFYGAKCGPCKATMPHYEEAAKFFIERGSTIVCVRLHAWESQEQTEWCKEHHEVVGVPRFKAFAHGQIVHDRQGGGDLPTMKQVFEDIITEVHKRFGEKV